MTATRARVRDALAALRWSQATLVEACGVTPPTLRRWLSEKHPMPPAVLVWVEELAAHVRAHPAPRKSEGD